MAKRSWPFAAAPTGRRLEAEERDEDLVGTVVENRNHERATPENLTLAWRHLREVSEDELDEYLVVPGFVDLNAPGDADVVAFTVRDGYIVPLRPRGWTNHAGSKYVGGVGLRVIPGVPAPPSRDEPRIY